MRMVEVRLMAPVMVPSPVPDNKAGMDALPVPSPSAAAGAVLAGGGFAHGPFLVEPDGALLPLRVPALRFAWRGRPCEARIADGKLSLSAGAGAVPYTAERPADRPGAFAAIAALPAHLPGGWRLRLLPDHRLLLEAEDALPMPTSAVVLVGALVRFALALDPYLDRLESAGVAAAVGARPGTAKT
jgi:hypothetical protein